MERYRDGLTGKGTQTADPKFNFKKPVFKKKQGLDLQKVSELNKELTQPETILSVEKLKI